MTACAGNRFPFFRAIEGWQALVVGGGGVALRKARVLVQFGARVRAVALEYAPGFSELAVERAVRAFCPSDLNGARICIAATDDRAVNARIAQLCRARGIEVNVADDAALSTFCFPALLCRGALTAAVSTSGASPLAARWARDRIAEALPDDFGEVLARMEAARRIAMRTLPDAGKRARALRTVFARCLEERPLPADGELEDMIRTFSCTDLD